MEPIYTQEFHINDAAVDCCGRLKPSMILFYAQEVAGRHFERLAMDYDALAKRGMFWAITRCRVQITRLPRSGETITVETWPMPTTRVAYPRSVTARDRQGNPLFQVISLWVLMDLSSRAMVLPGKSGIEVKGLLQGSELAIPGSIVPKNVTKTSLRTVCFTDLDRNGHMNNTRYFDWIDDLLPSDFHAAHPYREFTICYHSEAREGQTLDLHWDILEDGTVMVDGHRTVADSASNRVFTARIIV